MGHLSSLDPLHIYFFKGNIMDQLFINGTMMGLPYLMAWNLFEGLILMFQVSRKKMEVKNLILAVQASFIADL